MKISRLAVPACVLLLAAGPLPAVALSSAVSPPTTFLPYGQGPDSQLTGTERGLGQALSLGGQATAAEPGPSYRADGMFVSRLPAGTRLTAGTQPAAGARLARGHGATATLTVHGTNLAGEPDNGDAVAVVNVDNDNLTNGFIGKQFSHGVATFTVPPGPYLVLAFFLSRSGHKITGTHVVVLPQVTVAGQATADTDARTAGSQVQLVTPRPADLLWAALDVYRETADHQILDIDAYSQQQGPIWINTTSSKVTIGSLRTSVAAGLMSPPGTTAPYLYNLVLESATGRIPAMRQAVRPAGLATVTARYYQAVPSLGQLYQRGLLPFQGGIIFGGFFPLTLPSQVTEYLTGTPSVTWFDEYAQTRVKWAGGQLDAQQAYFDGERVTQDWGEYPLRSAPDVSILGPADPWARQVPDGVVPSASRMGNSLQLEMDPFGDNQPGHTGGGYTSGSYQIDQNGIKIAGGNAVQRPGGWAFLERVALSPKPSLIRFTLTAARSRTLSRGQSDTLSTATRTTWTWRSARQPGVKLPLGWWCLQGPISPAGLGSRACAVQPLLTLRYAVQNLALDGAAPAGQQIVRLTVGHLQLAQAAPVTGAAVQISFDGGQTWHRAQVTGQGGTYTALFTAPTGTTVTLRTTATDAAGATITETITRAYATTQ